MIRWAGRDWYPLEFVSSMAFDAFRLCLGGKPKHFTRAEVHAWIDAMATV